MKKTRRIVAGNLLLIAVIYFLKVSRTKVIFFINDHNCFLFYKKEFDNIVRSFSFIPGKITPIPESVLVQVNKQLSPFPLLAQLIFFNNKTHSLLLKLQAGAALNSINNLAPNKG